MASIDVKPTPARIGSISDYPEEITRDKGEVEIQLDRLQTNLDLLDGTTSALYVRLHDVLSDTPVESKSDNDMPGLVPLADRIFRMNDQLEALMDRLKFLERRVQL